LRLLDSNHAHVNEITATLAARVGEWFGAGAALDAASAQLRLYPNSFMLRLRVRAGNDQPVLLVKIPRKPAHQSIDEALKNDYLREHTRDYFDFMLATWNAFEQANVPNCFAIRPLGYFEQWNAIAMLEAQGHSLKDMLVLGRPPQTREFQGHLANAARWVRIFHDRIGQRSVMDVPRAEIESRVDALLADLRKYSRGRVDTASIRTSLLAAVPDGWRVPVARTHDDYHYSNVLVSPEGRVCGLDARRRTVRNPIYADLATLLLDPATRVASMLTGGLLLPRRFFERSRQSILDGYFAAEPHDASILDFYCAIVALDKWMINERRLAAGMARFAGIVLRPWVRWYFSSLLRQYLVSLPSHVATMEAAG
jgi:hypothetical protein